MASITIDDEKKRMAFKIMDERDKMISDLIWNTAYQHYTKAHKAQLMDKIIDESSQQMKDAGITRREGEALIEEHAKNKKYNNSTQQYMVSIAKGVLDTTKGTRPSIGDFLMLVRFYREQNLAEMPEFERLARERISEAECSKGMRDLKRGLDNACRSINGCIANIKKLPQPEQDHAYTEFWENYVVHQGQLYKQVPAKHLGQSDLNAASGLTVTSSEHVINNLEEAFMHGQFSVNEDESSYPYKDISAQVGGQHVNAVAELVPLDNEQLAVVIEISKRLKDRLSSLGVTTQKVFVVLLALWMKRSDHSGFLTISIDTIAEKSGYKRRDNGAFDSKALKTVRDSLDTISRTRITVLEDNVRGKPIQTKEVAFYIKQVAQSESIPPMGKVEDYCDKVQVVPNDFIRTVVNNSKYIKGTDFKLHQLHPTNQRMDYTIYWHLLKDWRYNWKSHEGTTTKTIRDLLRWSGIEPDRDKIERPAKLIEQLDNALLTLKENNAIKEFGYSPDEKHIELMDSKRITQRRFEQLLDIDVVIECGNKYKQHMANYGQGNPKAKRLNDTISDFKEFLATSNMSQSLAAQELGISSRQIRNYFNGTHKPTRKNIEKIRALMDNRQNKQPSAQLEFLEG